MCSDFSRCLPSLPSNVCDLSRLEAPHCGFSQSNALCHQRYRILKPLGQGGSGKTLLACDEQQPEQTFCVIKPRLSSSNYQQAPDRLRQEAQQLAEVGEHPQIPRLLNTFEQDGQVFTVQEWIDGWTLEQEAAGMPFDEVEIWKLLRELLPVLQHLHDRNIIHCDVKPANIIRRRHPHRTAGNNRYQLVLVDFGDAKQVNGVQSFATEPLLGSAEYAAPEQIRGQAVFASDLYSLGVTCLALMTQMSPFDLYDMGEASWKWQAYLSQPISLLLKQVLCTLLQPTLRRRYQTAADVLSALDDLSTQAHKPLTQAAIASVPPTLAKTEPSTTTSQPVFAPFSAATIAAINTTRTVSAIAAATVYNPQTQRWHDFTPPAEFTAPTDERTLLSNSRAANSTATPHEWEHDVTLSCHQANRHQTSMGWRLFTLGIGTAVASVAATCLLLCISIIFLTLAIPQHSSATPSQADHSKTLQ